MRVGTPSQNAYFGGILSNDRSLVVILLSRTHICAVFFLFQGWSQPDSWKPRRFEAVAITAEDVCTVFVNVPEILADNKTVPLA